MDLINSTGILNKIKEFGLSKFPPKIRSVLLGGLIDGAAGMIDAGVLAGLDYVPKPLIGLFQSLVGKVNTDGAPKLIKTLVDSFMGKSIGGLKDTFDSILSGKIFSANSIQSTLNSLAKGQLGGVGQLLKDFGGVGIMSLIPGANILKGASTLFSLINGSGVFNTLFGGGGVGLSNVLGAFGLGGSIAGLVSPIVGLFGGIFGFGGGDPEKQCPCALTCREYNHLVTEDNKKLIEKCATIIANSASSYIGRGGLLRNNSNPIAQAFGLNPTNIGKNLIPSNVSNLTEGILNFSRLNNMANEFESSRHADFPEVFSEMSYTFKGIETGFKVVDNNITVIEKILRLFIGSNNNTRDFFNSSLPQVYNTIGRTANNTNTNTNYIRKIDNSVNKEFKALKEDIEKAQDRLNLLTKDNNLHHQYFEIKDTYQADLVLDLARIISRFSKDLKYDPDSKEYKIKSTKFLNDLRLFSEKLSAGVYLNRVLSATPQLVTDIEAVHRELGNEIKLRGPNYSGLGNMADFSVKEDLQSLSELYQDKWKSYHNGNEYTSIKSLWDSLQPGPPQSFDSEGNPIWGSTWEDTPETIEPTFSDNLGNRYDHNFDYYTQKREIYSSGLTPNLNQLINEQNSTQKRKANC